MLENKISILQGNEASKLFHHPQFCEAWDILFDACPWATVFQSRKFVTSWLDHFIYAPILITDWNGISLTGLLVLVDGGENFTAPGFDLAEYQVWLSFPEEKEKFINGALREFSKTFPKRILHLKYIPDVQQIEVLEKNKYLDSRTTWKAYQRPIMEADKEWLQQELKKKNRKEKINRLKRLGDFRFVQLSDFDDFSSSIEEMVIQNDFRKAALYNKSFFHDEPERRDFLLDLFKLGLLHVSILRVGDVTIAANAGIMGKDMVYLQGINCHSPFYSKYSPGILHFLMLGLSLRDANLTCLDLTPGGADGYKSLLANKHEMAYEFWYGPRPFIFVKRTIEKLKDWLKSRLKGKKFLNIDPSTFSVFLSQLKLNLSFWKRSHFWRSKRERTNFLKGQTHMLQLSGKLELNETNHMQASNPTDQSIVISKNKLSDLFLWNKKASNIPRIHLFQDCLARIENGQEMFTLVSNNSLTGICWFIPIAANKGNLSKDTLKLPTELPLISCSYYVIGKEQLVKNWVHDMLIKNEMQLDPSKGFILELAKEQKELVGVALESGYWRMIGC